MKRLILIVGGVALARLGWAETPQCFAQLERPLSLINVIIGANCQMPQNPFGIHLYPFARFILRPTSVRELRQPPTAEEIARYAHASEKMHRYFCVPVSRHRGQAPHFVHRKRFEKVVGDLKSDLLEMLSETIEKLDPKIFRHAFDLAEHDRRLDHFLATPSHARTQLWLIADFLLEFLESRRVRDLATEYRHALRSAMVLEDRRARTFELTDQLSLRLHELLKLRSESSDEADVRELAHILTHLVSVEQIAYVAR